MSNFGEKIKAEIERNVLKKTELIMLRVGELIIFIKCVRPFIHVYKEYPCYTILDIYSIRYLLAQISNLTKKIPFHKILPTVVLNRTTLPVVFVFLLKTLLGIFRQLLAKNQT